MDNKYGRLGENLAKIRKEKQMSQSELAKLLNVSVSAVSKWENSKNLPDIEMIRSIASIFQVPMEAILGTNFSAPDKRSSEEVQEKLLTTKKKFRRKIILISVGIPLVIIGIIVYILYQNYLDSLPYRIINTRSIMGSTWGPTTEISVLYNTSLDNELLDIITYQIKREWLEEDKHGGAFVDAIKVSLYQDKQDANSFSPESDSYFYIFDLDRSHPE